MADASQIDGSEGAVSDRPESSGKPTVPLFEFITPKGKATVFSSADDIPREDWSEFHGHLCKDGRYYSILERSVRKGFRYATIVVRDQNGKARAVQPVFLVFQDITEGLGKKAREGVHKLRRFLGENFLRIPMLMVGCSAGEGRPGISDPEWLEDLSHAIVRFAKKSGAQLITWKDVPAEYRPLMGKMRNYIGIPSFPNVAMSLDFTSFEEFAQEKLSKVTRKGLRRKFRECEEAGTLEMETRTDAGPYLEEMFALYKQVLDRSKFRFEELTPDFIRLLGEEMPDKVRYFLWRLDGKLVAFSLCLVHGNTISDSYLGMEYPLALKLNLYFVTLRDVMEWSAKNGFKKYVSTPLNYDPKQHLRFHIDPLDLYVRHPSALLTKLIGPFIRKLEPTQYDPVLKRFENFDELALAGFGDKKP